LKLPTLENGKYSVGWFISEIEKFCEINKELFGSNDPTQRFSIYCLSTVQLLALFETDVKNR
jgi:hypothetical protein